MGCMVFSIIVAITQCEHLHSIPCNPFAAIKKLQSKLHHVKGPLKIMYNFPYEYLSRIIKNVLPAHRIVLFN